MRKSTLTLTLTLLSPALLVGCSNNDRNCDPRYENCPRNGSSTYYRGGSGVGTYIGTTSYSSGRTGTSTGRSSVSSSSRGGFGSFGGHFGGFGG